MLHKLLSLQTLHRDRAALDRVQGIASFDLDGRILEANDVFLQQLGYGREELIGQAYGSLVDASLSEGPAHDAFWQRLTSGRVEQGLYAHRHKLGHEIWLQSSYNPIRDRHGKVVRVVHYAIDVTEQQQQASGVQGKLQAIERSQGSIEFSVEGIVLDVNDNFLRTVGYQREEIVGQHHRLFVDPAEHRSASYAQFWQHLAGGHYHAGVYRRLGKQGREVWIQASYNPVMDAHGRVMRVVKYASDITAQTLAAQTLQSSVSGLSNTVLGNAQHARHAQRITQQARLIAERGGEAVTGAAATMQAIEESSRAVAQVTELINTIAFQTNLLALNAAIESAHAGESSKGFSVVANEIRQLAQRCTQAARDIDTLVEATQSRVAGGVAMIDAADQVMREIILSVSEVDKVVDDISRSAELQSSGIHAVNQAAAQLEQVYRC